MSQATNSPEELAEANFEAANDKEESTLDAILVRIGEFGKFQILIFLMISIPMLFHAIYSVTYIFTSSTVVQRCYISGCDTAQSVYNEPWTEFTIPHDGKELNQCNRYANRTPTNQRTFIKPREEEWQCERDSFNQDEIIKCPNNNFIFRDKEVTISNDFGIFCSEEWKLTLVGTINNIGQFVGIPLGGFISDRYGRRTSLALGCFFSAILGIVRSFSPNYIVFLIFEFLDNVTGSTLYGTCFILGIELVGPSRRVIACSLITIFYAIGEILLAVVAKYSLNWRLLLQIVYTPALALIAYLWILPESVRWQLSQGKEEEAKYTLKRAARVNKRRLSDNSLDKLVLANREKLQASVGGKFPIKKAFTTLFWRIANCSLCWIINVLVYYGISVNAVLLDGDKYNNFMFIALVEIPGFFLPFLIMDRMGRRFSLFACMLITGMCCLCTIFVGSEQITLRLILFLVGKLTITASFQVLYFFTSEIFPTNLRNSLLSFCSMVGRVGSMVAPQTPLLAKLDPRAPAILFSVAATISGCLALLFPETTNLILPTTLKEADSIGMKKKKETISCQQLT